MEQYSSSCLLAFLTTKHALTFFDLFMLSSHNRCQKSWNTYVISGDHLVVSLSPPQNNVDAYSVDRYRNSRYAYTLL